MCDTERERVSRSVITRWGDRQKKNFHCLIDLPFFQPISNCNDNEDELRDKDFSCVRLQFLLILSLFMLINSKITAAPFISIFFVRTTNIFDRKKKWQHNVLLLRMICNDDFRLNDVIVGGGANITFIPKAAEKNSVYMIKWPNELTKQKAIKNGGQCKRTHYK